MMKSNAQKKKLAKFLLMVYNGGRPTGDPPPSPPLPKGGMSRHRRDRGDFLPLPQTLAQPPVIHTLFTKNTCTRPRRVLQ